ncbi:hydroxyethylthiazole kinase [Paenirhodobacter populi]|uniref:hydroxyethylthiazole kinase n=1 Tax=Paenirhodobacter populi TaxID=2306993 RepID=UPI000FE2C87A|nr:hydroxyethylthiazole kinase [Sinirhodobacter populi]RWR04906.1 hydroxyethylthiazole kinase [Sinirhodobacter populi]
MKQMSWDDAEIRAELARLKALKPFCYGLTNYVAANLSANVLLAVGAGPAIGTAMDWPGVFGRHAHAVWINAASLMSCGPDQIRLAARSAHEGGVPWVLDPVAVGAGAAEYDAVVKGLLEFMPAAIRGNASELVALAGGVGGGQGVETTLTSDTALPFLQQVAAELGTIAAVSGPVDYITDGKTTVSVGGGDARLTQVTGAGCALGALISGLLAGAEDRLTAVVAAHAIYARAAERASAAKGTGSFAVAFLDQLSLIDPAE